jgi:hypothetical protein
MNCLTTLRFCSLPNAAHYAFCETVSETLADSPSDLLAALGTLPQRFKACLADERANMDRVRRNVLTGQIRDAGRQMARALTAVKAQVRAQQYSDALDIVPAANRVYLMLKNYGDVNSKPYLVQEGDVRVIIRQLQAGGAYYADAVALGLSASTNKLQNAAARFRQLLDQRGKQSLGKPGKTFCVVRREIESVYRLIATILSGGAAFNASPSYAAFINRLNPEINRLNATYHHVRRDIAHAEPEAIAVQTYAGHPVTPTPAVYDGAVLLELGKDYNLTYSDNAKPGIAQCTLHGKGDYKGRKTVTFKIS